MEQARYRMIKKLGEGATAEVFLVWDTLLERNTAVKRGRDKALLYAEAKILASVSHPAFPNMYDYREDEMGASLFMEYIAGETLRERQERIGRYTKEEVFCIVCKTAQAILFLHESEPVLVYGDIKPENILVQSDGSVRLVDFGTVCALTGQRQTVKEGTSLRGGTPLFAPPERWKGNPDVRGDIYALGKLMQVLLQKTGREEEENGYMRIIERCTQKNPGSRYQSVREFLDAVNTLNMPCRRY